MVTSSSRNKVTASVNGDLFSRVDFHWNSLRIETAYMFGDLEMVCDPQIQILTRDSPLKRTLCGGLQQLINGTNVFITIRIRMIGHFLLPK